MSHQLKLRIRKVFWKSIRQFEAVEALPKDGLNWWLMRNGIGKTTTLKLLRALFSGELPDSNQISNFRYNQDPEQDLGGNPDSGEFGVTLVIENPQHPGKWVSWTITLQIDNSTTPPSASFQTTSPDIGGTKDGWLLPPEFKRHFHGKSNFVELFIFDGETAQDICKSQGQDRIKKAICEITGLNKIQDLVVSEYCQLSKIFEKACERQNSAGNPQSQQTKSSLDQLKVHISNLEEEQTNLEIARLDMEEQIVGLVAEMQSIDTQQEQQKEISHYESRIKSNNIEIKSICGKILAGLAKPSNINPSMWSGVHKLTTAMLRARIPESVGQAFFEQLLHQDNCICGQSWTGNMRSHVTEQSKNYLGDEILVVVRGMQKEVEDNPASDFSFPDAFNNIHGLRQDNDTSKHELAVIRSNYDPDAAEKRENLLKFKHKFETDLKKITQQIQNISETDNYVITTHNWDRGSRTTAGAPTLQPHIFTTCNNLKSLKEIENHLEEKLAVTHELQILQRATHTARTVIFQALTEVMEDLQRELKSETNRLLDTIDSKGGGNTRIDFDRAGLLFINETGQVQEAANIGAVVSAAYCFISSLAKLGNMDVPLICDSPVTGLDTFAIKGWANSVLSDFGQFIGFITTAERDVIENASSTSNQLLYANDSTLLTFHREDETITGDPQTGSIVANADIQFFKDYGPEYSVQ